MNCRDAVARPAQPAHRRDLLISLLPHFADFATAFHEVIDFVPYEDTLKQLARDRYKAYRSVGFQLNTAAPPLQHVEGCVFHRFAHQKIKGGMISALAVRKEGA